MKKNHLALWLIFGGLLGGVLSTWLSPYVIAWYFEPPVNIGINCRSAVEWAMGKFRMAQIYGIGAGLLLGALISLARRGKGTGPGSGDITFSPGSRID